VSAQTAIKIKTALISVSDKSDLDQLAATLRSHDIAIVSTGGTAAYLKEQNFKVTEVSAITGFPEMMGGRVKTLHPLIYAGLLNRPVIDDKLLEKYSITNSDLVVVNL
jgi:phosphoribosylaminoimidazolecarboxamide formyltransferase/IMP cyclohydrolase